MVHHEHEEIYYRELRRPADSRYAGTVALNPTSRIPSTPLIRQRPVATTAHTNIPYGNAADVAISAGTDCKVISFAAHPHGGPECLWFCFRIEQQSAGTAKKMRLVLKHVSNMLGGLVCVTNFRPVIRKASGDWTRLPAPERSETKDGRVDATWDIEDPGATVDVAVCYPYGRPDVDELLKETGDTYKADVIGVSQGGRPMLRLSNSAGDKERKQAGIYLLARQHSGETPGSWVLDGFLREMAEARTKAPLIWCVPLTNIDGVEQGDYGKDNFPHDLNRAWGRPAMRHETHVMQFDLWRWKERCQPKLMIDFHAPGATENDGLYVFAPDPEKSPEQSAAVLRWSAILQQTLTPEFASPEFSRVSKYPSRWNTPTASTFAWENLGIPCLSLEVPYALTGETPLTRERYREAGRRIAGAVAEQLQNNSSN